MKPLTPQSRMQDIGNIIGAHRTIEQLSAITSLIQDEDRRIEVGIRIAAATLCGIAATKDKSPADIEQTRANLHALVDEYLDKVTTDIPSTPADLKTEQH